MAKISGTTGKDNCVFLLHLFLPKKVLVQVLYKILTKFTQPFHDQTLTSPPLLVLPICCFPTPPHVQATAEWPAWASHGLGLLRSCYRMHRGRQQQLSPCRRETWLEIGGKEVPRKWRYRLRGGRAFGSVKIASQICVCWWKWWGFWCQQPFSTPKKASANKKVKGF